MHRSPNRSGTQWAAVFGTFAVAALAGCSDASETRERQSGGSARGLAEAVVGRAADAIDGDGLLRLPARSLSPREITDLRAGRLAQAYANTFGPYLLPELEEQQQGQIDVTKLSACGRAFYARSSYEPLPDFIDRPTQSAFGSWWIVSLCDGGSPAIVVAVSSLASDVGVDAKGALVYSGSIAGNEFVMRGVPPGRRYGLLTTPEEAVVKASRLTARRVAEVPILIAPALGNGGGLAAWWRIKLETATHFKRKNAGGSTEVVTDELGVQSSERDEVVAADASQPVAQLLYEIVGSGDGITFRQSSVSRDPSIPLLLTAVVPTEAP